MKKFLIKVNNKSYEVEVEEIDSTQQTNRVDTVTTTTIPAEKQAPKAKPAQISNDVSAPSGSTEINSPMPGNILSIKVKKGDKVSKGDVLLILEAMKMENEIKAPISGQVVSVAVVQGAAVNSNDLLIAIA